MTPAEHLAQAEAWLSNPPPADHPQYTVMDIAISLNALAHAVVAIAAELGVPHGGTGGGGDSAQAQQAAG